MNRSIRAAICRIDVIRDGETVSRGTGTLVAPGIVLTALHVVADRKASPPSPHPGLLVLTFPDHKTEARIHGDDLNPNDDWVLLQCEAPPPVPPVPMGRLSQRGVEWETYGWPDANSRDGMTLSGTVENCEGELEGVTALQLFSKEAAAGAGAKVSGLSGAPVIVNGWLVGHMRFALMQGGRTEAGTVYACPAAAVAKRCPTVLTLGTVPYRQSTNTVIITESRRRARWAILGVVLAATLVVSLLVRGRDRGGNDPTDSLTVDSLTVDSLTEGNDSLAEGNDSLAEGNDSLTPVLPVVLTLQIPSTTPLFNETLILTTSEGSTPHRVNIVLSSPSHGEVAAWTGSRGDELAQTSSRDFEFGGRHMFIYIIELPTTPIGSVALRVGER